MNIIPIYCCYSSVENIKNLNPHPKNPNNHPDQQIKLLAKIIKKQGWRNPIIVSRRSGWIVKGHARYLAALENGEKKVPIDLQDYYSDEMEMADMIADNKIAELAFMSDEIIHDIALDLSPDFDFDLFGVPDFFIPGVGCVKDEPEDSFELKLKSVICPKCEHSFKI